MVYKSVDFGCTSVYEYPAKDSHPEKVEGSPSLPPQARPPRSVPLSASPVLTFHPSNLPTSKRLTLLALGYFRQRTRNSTSLNTLHTLFRRNGAGKNRPNLTSHLRIKMEPTTPQTQQTQSDTPTPAASAADSRRCPHTTRSGRRCRLPIQDHAAGLCFRHASLARRTALDDSLDLSREIFAKKEGAYDSTEVINLILSNVIELVAMGRLSPRRAAVITCALSLMLRSNVVSERQALSQLPLDYIPREPLEKEPFTPPTTPEEAIAAYERLRT